MNLEVLRAFPSSSTSVTISVASLVFIARVVFVHLIFINPPQCPVAFSTAPTFSSSPASTLPIPCPFAFRLSPCLCHSVASFSSNHLITSSRSSLSECIPHSQQPNPVMQAVFTEHWTRLLLAYAHQAAYSRCGSRTPRYRLALAPAAATATASGTKC